jgi:transcriptional regulator with XRE-family HTH domain
MPFLIGGIIKAARIKKGLSQEVLADLVDVAPAYICRLEKGENPPSDGLCIKLATVLQLPERLFRIAALEKRVGIKLSDLGLLAKSEPETELFSLFHSLGGR